MTAYERVALTPEASLVFQRVAASNEEARALAALRDEFPGTSPDWTLPESEAARQRPPAPGRRFWRRRRGTAAGLPPAVARTRDYDPAAACAVHAGRG